MKLMDRYAMAMMFALFLTLGCAGCSTAPGTAGTAGQNSQGPFSVVQAPPATTLVNVGGVPGGATLTINANPTVAGHGFLVVVSGEYFSNSAAGCSDNSSSGASNTYTLIPSAHASVNLPNYGDSSGFSDIFYVASSVGSVTQVQCTLTTEFSTGDAEIWFLELNQPIGGVDQVAVRDNQSATSTTCTGPMITTRQADEFVLSAIWLSHDVLSVNNPPFTQGSDARGNSIGYYAPAAPGLFQPIYVSDSQGDGYAINAVSFTSGSAAAAHSPTTIGSMNPAVRNAGEFLMGHHRRSE